MDVFNFIDVSGGASHWRRKSSTF